MAIINGNFNSKKLSTKNIILNLMKKLFIISSLFALPIVSAAYMLKDDIYFRYFTKHGKMKKDETRFNTNYYGLNWGSRTDEIVS